MAVHVRRIEHYVLNMRTRMPFRYGIASMTALPHVFLRLEAEVDGRHSVGVASEGLAPKWFTKDPTTPFRRDLEDMLAVIQHASTAAVDAGEQASVFRISRETYAAQRRWAAGRYPPLLAGLGPALVERALIDAYCRAAGTTFGRALRDGALGVRLGEIHGSLEGVEPAALLPNTPLRRIIARHTVGLADPLTENEIDADERLDDGLPQSLEACIRAYGLTHFKVKVFGDLDRDVDRLSRLARVLAGGTGGEYALTLDGNEQFHAVDALRAYWDALRNELALGTLLKRVLFVEQPLHRDDALTAREAAALRAWDERPRMIIDESDGDETSLPQALEAGYVGTSVKNCKGVFRGVANACLLRRLGGDHELSGEDLANVGPVAMLQDLATAATLGIEHVERNGHHYFRGLSMLPPDVQAPVLEAHGDLYRRHTDGFPTLDIRAGRLAVGSVVDAPYGVAPLVEPRAFTPLGEWRFESLGIAE